MTQELTTAKEMMLDASNQRERGILIEEREFSLQQRRANVLASSSIVPKEYQGNIANCIIAMEMAQRLNAGELEIMQNLHVIHGRPSFSASYLIAQVNKSGVIRGRLKFRMTGEKGADSWGCIAYGEDRETGEVLESTEITLKLAKDEGWFSKNGSKWKTMPEQMLQYRAASFWSRLYAPDATMGMHTVDEVRDTGERDITPEKNTLKSDLEVIPRPKPEIELKSVEASKEQEQETELETFGALTKRLLKTKTEDAARKLLDSKDFDSLDNEAQERFAAKVENHSRALAAGMDK